MDWEEKELHQHQWHRAEEPPKQKGKSLSSLLLALRGFKGRWRRWAGTTVPCSSSSWAVDTFAEEEEHWWHWGGGAQSCCSFPDVQSSNQSAPEQAVLCWAGLLSVKGWQQGEEQSCTCILNRCFM